MCCLLLCEDWVRATSSRTPQEMTTHLPVCQSPGGRSAQTTVGLALWAPTGRQTQSTRQWAARVKAQSLPHPRWIPHRRARKGLYILSRSFPRGRRPQGGRQGRHYQNPHLFKASAPSCPLGLPVEQEASVQPPECGPVSSALWPQGTGRLSCPFLPVP